MDCAEKMPLLGTFDAGGEYCGFGLKSALNCGNGIREFEFVMAADSGRVLLARSLGRGPGLMVVDNEYLYESQEAEGALRSNAFLFCFLFLFCFGLDFIFFANPYNYSRKGASRAAYKSPDTTDRSPPTRMLRA